MTRKILFRGKHIHALPQNEHLDGTWVYGYLCNENYINSPELEGELLIDSETICQYIGTNRNDEKIWEGDIFREDNGEYIATYFIEWDDTNMQWWAREIESSEGDLPLCEFYSSEIDVIGNMFDNPEIAEQITKEKWNRR